MTRQPFFLWDIPLNHRFLYRDDDIPGLWPRSLVCDRKGEESHWFASCDFNNDRRLRHLYMIIIQMYVIENFVFMKIACVLLEYLTRVVPSLSDWRVVCISIERTHMIIKDVHFTKTLALQVQKLARWIVLLVILLKNEINVYYLLWREWLMLLVIDDLPPNSNMIEWSNERTEVVEMQRVRPLCERRVDSSERYHRHDCPLESLTMGSMKWRHVEYVD